MFAENNTQLFCWVRSKVGSVIQIFKNLKLLKPKHSEDWFLGAIQKPNYFDQFFNCFLSRNQTIYLVFGVIPNLNHL